MKGIKLIGIILHAIYYILIIFSFGNYDYPGYGFGIGFVLWFFAVLISIPIIILYLIDGIVLLAKNRNLFNALKLILIVILELVPFFSKKIIRK
jgi:hypothetical protein